MWVLLFSLSALGYWGGGVYNCLYNKYDKCKLVKFVNNAHCCKNAFVLQVDNLERKRNPLIYIHLKYDETKLSWIKVIKDQFS